MPRFALRSSGVCGCARHRLPHFHAVLIFRVLLVLVRGLCLDLGIVAVRWTAGRFVQPFYVMNVFHVRFHKSAARFDFVLVEFLFCHCFIKVVMQTVFHVFA